MELTEEEHQTNRNILTNLIADAPAEIATILTCYNYDENADSIYNQMNKFRKPQLQDAANFLDQLPKSYKYKNELIQGIISRIDSLLLELCSKCEIKYSIDKTEVPILSCINCGQGCHTECYSDIVDIIKLYPGIHYQCHRCEAKSNQAGPIIATQVHSKSPNDENDSDDDDDELTPYQRPRENEGTPPHQPPHQNEGTPPHQPPHQNEGTPPHQPPHQNDGETTKPTCQKYIRGSCPHGISGKTPVNGQICSFSHPKRCMKFCRNGPYSKYGCDKGRECQYMHPVLCKYSLKFRKCTNLRCKFTHLKFTKRYDTVDPKSPPIEENSATEYQSATQYSPQNNTNQTCQSTEGNHFLEMLPEILSKIQEELKLLKEQKSHQPPAPPPLPIPLPMMSPTHQTYPQYQNLHIQPPPIDLTQKRAQQMLEKPTAHLQANNQLPALLQQISNQFPSPTLPMHQ